MQIPVIDFQTYDESNPESLELLAEQVKKALSEVGFMSVTNLGIDKKLLETVFANNKDYFAQSRQEKMQQAYTNAEENFGYQALLDETLNPAFPADLKESFVMCDPVEHAKDITRWPSEDFLDLTLTFYKQCVECANKILRVFAVALGVEREFFVRCFTGENVTLRYLRYPTSGSEVESEKQLGAGAHTDYGIITLLFQDNVGGLEARGLDNKWHPVDYVEDAIVINTGDLMQRWTNKVFRSTPHRVQHKIGQKERFSIALFMDPDRDTMVETIPSCLNEERPEGYPPITAGEHILAKIKATHGRY